MKDIIIIIIVAIKMQKHINNIDSTTQSDDDGLSYVNGVSSVSIQTRGSFGTRNLFINEIIFQYSNIWTLQRGPVLYV